MAVESANFDRSRAAQMHARFRDMFWNTHEITFACPKKCQPRYTIENSQENSQDNHLLLPLLDSTHSLGQAIAAHMRDTARACKCGAAGGTDQKFLSKLPHYIVFTLGRVKVGTCG